MELNFKPRGWQKEALPLWLDNMRGVISVVTGGGKTFFAFLAIQEALKRQPDLQFVIIVPTSALLDQWYIGLIDDMGANKNDISCFSGKQKPTKANLINIIIINTARKKEIRTLFKIKPTMLIVDECHRSGSVENSKALNIEHKAALGLSATPVREFDDGFEKYIAARIGGIIYEYGYKDAFKDGILSEFELINIRTNFAEDEEVNYSKISKRIAVTISKVKKGLETIEKLTQLLIQRKRISNASVMRLFPVFKIILENPGKKIIVFTQSIEHSEFIYDFLKTKNINGTIYHSKIDQNKRRFNLLMFKKGVYDILVTCVALDEGLNVPSIEIGIIESSTSTDRQRIQRLGRILRKSDKKEKSYIYTVYITDQEEESLKKESINLESITETRWMTF